ncbi:hypothetical protein B0H19DRAFT_1197759 [Mycena capillaripes]|nr:hypothetical protein B0H19DRAFT_1197759 [Mycena capillaripes]
MTSVQRYGDTGITILHRAVALEALRDSADSFPQPKCHPETRSQTLDMLWAWATKANRHKHILWLCGPAGAGKSAIVQTLSQRLQAAKYLAPSFFFKRGHVTRGTAKVLFATLAYQMALQHPRLRTRISQIAEDDPSIVGRTASVQLQELVVEPCQSVAETDLVPILLIDGLDECESPEIQQHVLQSIGNAFRERRLPFKILIASRPEPHIQETFQGSHLKGLYHTLPLNQSFEDVEHYLRDEFARIHREHCSTMCTVPTPWPSADTIATLLSKSSGHFIYASTIIKYIDDKNFRPNERLRLVENFGATDSGSPFATLDQLYIQILSAIPAQQRLFRILTVLVVFSELSLSQIEQLLDVQRGDVPLALRGLHSVLRIPTDYSHPITVYHASFLDFLDNPARSGVFCVRDAQKQEDLAVSVIKMLDSLTSFHYVAWEIKWIDYVTTSIPPSTSLIPLVRRIDCSFLYGKGFSNCRREQCLRNMVCWLEKTQPPPDDSIQMWRDYEFLAFCDTTFFLVARGDFWEQPLTQLQSKAFDELLLKSPELHRILDAWWICSDTRDGCLRRSPNLACIRLLLNLSWNQMTTAICLLRPFTTDGRERDELFQFLVRGSLLCREKYPLGRLDLYERIKGFIRRQRLADLGLQFEDIKREYFGQCCSYIDAEKYFYFPLRSPSVCSRVQSSALQSSSLSTRRLGPRF